MNYIGKKAKRLEGTKQKVCQQSNKEVVMNACRISDKKLVKNVCKKSSKEIGKKVHKTYQGI